VRSNLNKQVAIYLRKKRGNMSYAKFAKLAGISHQTLFRIDHGAQLVNLATLERVMGKLKIHRKDVFPDDF
jgi:transcriptional regulator with XRE-family HTH domain